LAKLWWPNIADALSGNKTPQEAMDNLAEEQDRALAVIERNYLAGRCGPKLVDDADIRGADYWLAQPGAPKPALANENPPGQTIRYEELLQSWGMSAN
ncbi:MAG: hypothetical protein B7X58_11060, partial [Marinobacter sp. 34-60-7]